MEAGQPSSTAIASAMMRAGHLLFDGTPKILQDDLALGLSGFENEAALARALDELRHNEAQRSTPEFAQLLFRSLRAIMVVRNRYAEDELHRARQRGVTQYVLLGAGLDSFAYRRPDVAEVLRVFEVDYPSSQQWKRARLRELQVRLPANLTFIPIDFEHQTLREALAAGGYRMEEAAFFSWLGVTQYLTPNATVGTLQEIVS
jgi:methyltransferase (TIGR00027 family)